MAKKLQWKKLISRGMHPTLPIDSTWRGLLYYYKPILKLGFNVKYYKRYEGSTYISLFEWKKIIKAFEIKLEKSSVNLYQPIKQCKNINRQLLKFCQLVRQLNLKQKSVKKLKVLTKIFLKQYNKLTVFYYVPWYGEEVLERNIKIELLRRLQKLKKVEKLDEYYSILSVMPRPARIMREKRALLTISLAIYRNRDYRKIFHSQSQLQIIKKIMGSTLYYQLERHRRKYIWLPTYLYNVRELSLEHIVDNIKELIIKNPIQEITNLNEQEKSNKLLFNKVAKELSIRGKLFIDVKLLREWVFFRQDRMEDWSEIHYTIKPLFEELARRYGMNYQNIVYLTINEILSGKFKFKDIKDREKGYAIEMVGSRVRYYTGWKLRDFLKKEKREIQNDNVQEFKGQIANLGKVVGRVKIGTSYTFQHLNLKKGDVLVTGMTTPESVAYIKKVSAIITDEGGMLCHAAIISRELKKPCIIGTKNATSILRDGDLVEVDANNGIVKILKRA